MRVEILGKLQGQAVGTAPVLARRRARPLATEENYTHPVAPILAALGELTPTTPAGSEEVRKALGYFTTNAARMNYPAFVARQLPIESGAVESACKTLIEEREKGAGMRWTKTGAQVVATLRALQRSGRWTAFWATHPQRRRPAVFPRHPPDAAAHPEPLKQAA